MTEPLTDEQLRGYRERFTREKAYAASSIATEAIEAEYLASVALALLAEIERLKAREAELTIVLNSANRSLAGGVERYLEGLGEDLAAKMRGLDR